MAKKQKRTRYGLNNAILQYISTHPKTVHKEPKICAIVSHELYTKSLFISSVVSYLYKCNAQSCNFKKMENYETKLLKQPKLAVKPYLSIQSVGSWYEDSYEASYQLSATKTDDENQLLTSDSKKSCMNPPTYYSRVQNKHTGSLKGVYLLTFFYFL